MAVRAERLQKKKKEKKPSLSFHPGLQNVLGTEMLRPAPFDHPAGPRALEGGVSRAEVKVSPSVGLFRCLFFPVFPVVGSCPGPPVS